MHEAKRWVPSIREKAPMSNWDPLLGLSGELRQEVEIGKALGEKTPRCNGFGPGC